MRRLLVVAAVAVCSIGFASEAMASTSVSVSMTFTEPAVPSLNSGCPASPEGFCGSGEVIPLGRATEMIEFGAGCGGACDLRTVNLPGGSIVMDEVFTDFRCPGTCGGYRGRGEPAAGTLTDTIVGGTGSYAGAAGVLSGTVKAAGLTSQVKFSGTITR